MPTQSTACEMKADCGIALGHMQQYLVLMVATIVVAFQMLRNDSQPEVEMWTDT
jgi:hypothetical protein